MSWIGKVNRGDDKPPTFYSKYFKILHIKYSLYTPSDIHSTCVPSEKFLLCIIHICHKHILKKKSQEASLPHLFTVLHSLHLTIDLRISESLVFALFSANSRLLMSLRRALYLFICSTTISSTHLKKGERKNCYKQK